VRFVDLIQQACGNEIDFIINPAAYTHTSVVIRDALAAVSISFIEVHIANLHAQERFRHHSYLSDKAAGCVIGLGTFGYETAVQSAILQLKSESNSFIINMKLLA
jgi:3-dehydroquinate dehydratase-2